MKVLGFHKAYTAVGQYRIWTPMKYLAREAGWETRTYPRWATSERVLAGHGQVFNVQEDLNWADLALWQWFGSEVEQRALVGWRQVTGIPCIMDLDDEVRNLPQEHMAYEGFRERTEAECEEVLDGVQPEAIRVLSSRGYVIRRSPEGVLQAVRRTAENFPARFAEVVKHLNGLFVSTPYLANEYRKLLPDQWPVFVVPNCYDPDDWDHLTLPTPRPGPTLLWAGSIAHGGNVKVAFEGLRRVFKARPDVRLLVMGAKLKEFAELPPANVEYVGWCPVDDYPAHLTNQGAWIGIAPATDHPFNRAKSHIRWMEYTLAGLPTVASPLPEYLTWANDGAAFAATDDEWAGRLLELLDSATLRADLLAAARERVRICDIRCQIDKWVHYCTQAIQVGVNQMYVTPPAPEAPTTPPEGA